MERPRSTRVDLTVNRKALPIRVVDSVRRNTQDIRRVTTQTLVATGALGFLTVGMIFEEAKKPGPKKVDTDKAKRLMEEETKKTQEYFRAAYKKFGVVRD